MTVYFVSAGPGAPDLLTLRAKSIIEQCPNILYAGSLIPDAVLKFAGTQTKKINTATLSRSEIFEHFKSAAANGEDLARLHSGDVSLYSAMTEQIDYLIEHKINYEIIPGVPSYTAAAASFGLELTNPGLCQSLILTRTSKKSSKMPETETLEIFAQSNATIAIHLSAKNVEDIKSELLPHYGPDCPVLIAVEVSWPSEKCISTTLEHLPQTIQQHAIERTAIIFVGNSLGRKSSIKSALYDKDHKRHLKEGPDE